MSELKVSVYLPEISEIVLSKLVTLPTYVDKNDLCFGKLANYSPCLAGLMKPGISTIILQIYTQELWSVFIFYY